ncbi:MAG: hypothetical protein IIA41_04685 [SAR324 cluster bacterium]|nr:hypothetical protein [SAR324 cluster bacterium]
MAKIKTAGMVLLLLSTLALLVSAQEKKPCEYAGKTYQHREQVWQKEGGGQCTVCWDGQWVPRAGVLDAEYCKGKY